MFIPMLSMCACQIPDFTAIYMLSSSFPNSSNAFILAMLRVLQASSGSGGDAGGFTLPLTSWWILGTKAADPVLLMGSTDEGATLRTYNEKR